MCLARLAVQSDVDVDQADDRPCEVRPPKDSRQLGEESRNTLGVEVVGPMRSNSCNQEHEAHAGEEQDLNDQAAGRTSSSLNMPDRDSGDPEDIDQDERQQMAITGHCSAEPHSGRLCSSRPLDDVVPSEALAVAGMSFVKRLVIPEDRDPSIGIAVDCHPSEGRKWHM